MAQPGSAKQVEAQAGDSGRESYWAGYTLVLPEPGEVLSSADTDHLLQNANSNGEGHCSKSLSLGLQIKEAQSIRLWLDYSKFSTRRDPGDSPPSLTPAVCWDMAPRERQRDLDV